VDPSRASTWHLHARQAIHVEDHRFEFDNGSYRLWGETLLPQAPPAALTVAAEREGPNKEITSYRLDLSLAGGNPVGHLLNVLQIRRVSAVAPLPAEHIRDRDGAMDGVAVNGWLVMAGRQSAPVATTSYRPPTEVVHHLLADLLPHHSYALTTMDANGQDLRQATLAVSAAGTLRIDAQPGEVTFSLAAVGPARLAAADPLRIVEGVSSPTRRR
jgi:hypothetical protein